MNDEKEELEIIVERVLGLIVCTNITDEDLLTAKVNKMHLCGTSAGWVISERSDRILQCDKHSNRNHVLFTC